MARITQGDKLETETELVLRFLSGARVNKEAKRMATKGYSMITVKEEFILLESPDNNTRRRLSYG